MTLGLRNLEYFCCDILGGVGESRGVGESGGGISNNIHDIHVHVYHYKENNNQLIKYIFVTSATAQMYRNKRTD